VIASQADDLAEQSKRARRQRRAIGGAYTAQAEDLPGKIFQRRTGYFGGSQRVRAKGSEYLGSKISQIVQRQAYMNPLLPDNILTKLSEADRRSLGRAGMTSAEAQAKYATGVERAEQKIFSMWLTQRGLYFIQARADRKSTIRVGHPDFSIFRDGRTLFLEMKCPHAQPTKEQIQCINELRTAGFEAEIVRSAASAIETTKRYFGLV
jgi:hypothetical protein